MNKLEAKKRLNKSHDILIDLKEDISYHLQFLSDDKFPTIKEKFRYSF